MFSAFAAGWSYATALQHFCDGHYGWGTVKLILGILNTVFIFI